MRVGVFGGTFDPVHTGHLIVAEQAREQARLDEVWFVPAAHPPHKGAPTLTRLEQRAEMLALAVAGNPAFRVDELEKERPGPSYTADTLAELRRRHPDHEFLLLIGSDTLLDLPTWHQPLRVLEQAALLVAARPGSAVMSADELRARLQAPAEVPVRLETVAIPLVDIASRDLRRRAADGRSLRYFLPRAVECYLREKRLYRIAPPPSPPGGEGRKTPLACREAPPSGQ